MMAETWQFWTLLPCYTGISEAVARPDRAFILRQRGTILAAAETGRYSDVHLSAVLWIKPAA